MNRKQQVWASRDCKRVYIYNALCNTMAWGQHVAPIANFARVFGQNHPEVSRGVVWSYYEKDTQSMPKNLWLVWEGDDKLGMAETVCQIYNSLQRGPPPECEGCHHCKCGCCSSEKLFAEDPKSICCDGSSCCH